MSMTNGKDISCFDKRYIKDDKILKQMMIQEQNHYKLFLNQYLSSSKNKTGRQYKPENKTFLNYAT
jgi:hypothetical protein